MNNELERILGEVADDASRRAGALPLDDLRARGARRRRARQAGYGVVGVAAAFGLILATTQLLPDAEDPSPAGPTGVDWPTADPTLPLGACGSVVTNLPTFDSGVWLELSTEEATVPFGEPAPLSVTVENFGTEPLDLSRGEGPYLFVVRDGVVVGFSWSETPADDAVPAQGEHVHDDLGPFVLCEQGELRPAGDPAARTPLPVGSYTIQSAITLAPDDERADADWAFELLGRDASLTVAPPAYTFDDDLPVCGAPIEGHEFAPDVAVDPALPLEVTVRETSTGSELFLAARFRSTLGDGVQVPADDLAVVMAQDGVVVGYARRVALGGGVVGPDEVVTHEGLVGWTDCATGEEIEAPEGDFEVLALRTLTVGLPDGSWKKVTIGYAPVPLSVGASTSSQDTTVDVGLPVCGEPIAGFAFPQSVQVSDEHPIGVTVGHSGPDDTGFETFFGDGYGDQLRVDLPHANTETDLADVREIDAGVAVARDGVVVAEMTWPAWSGTGWPSWPRGESRQISPVSDWVDCASGEPGQVPPGDYEILGWRSFGFTRADGSTEALTVGYPAAAFTAYDFEDPDNPGTCGPLQIPRFLDGSPAAAPRIVVATGKSPYAMWDNDDEMITQLWGNVALAEAGVAVTELDPAHYPDRQRVEGPSGTHLIMPVGDFGVSMVQLRTVREACPTVTWLPAGTTLQQARAFAAEL